VYYAIFHFLILRFGSNDAAPRSVMGFAMMNVRNMALGNDGQSWGRPKYCNYCDEQSWARPKYYNWSDRQYWTRPKCCNWS